MRAEVARQRAQAAMSAAYLRRELAARGTATLRICSDSMRPIARTDAVFRIRPVAPGEDLRGAIVAVDAGDVVIVHRVVKLTDDQVITRGIAVCHDDPPRPREAILGVASPRRGGRTAERALRLAAAVAAVTYRVRQPVRRCRQRARDVMRALRAPKM